MLTTTQPHVPVIMKYIVSTILYGTLKPIGENQALVNNGIYMGKMINDINV